MKKVAPRLLYTKTYVIRRVAVFANLHRVLFSTKPRERLAGSWQRTVNVDKFVRASYQESLMRA